MIPIISINFAIISFLSFAIAIHLLSSNNQKHSETALVKEFSYFYFFFGASFLSWAIPGLLVDQIEYFELFYLVGYFLFYMAIAYMGYIALSLSAKHSIAKLAFNVALALGILFTIIRFFNSEMPGIEISKNFIFWQPRYPQSLRLLTGLVSSIIALASALIFFIQGLNHKQNKFIFTRARWLAFGMFILFIASLTSFVKGQRASLTSSLEGTMLAIVALLSILKGVLHKQPSR